MIMTLAMGLLTRQLQDNGRSVDSVLATSSKKGYFGDQNSNNTNQPEFKRILEENESRQLTQRRKLSDLRRSDDYAELQKEAKTYSLRTRQLIAEFEFMRARDPQHNRVIDAYR